MTVLVIFMHVVLDAVAGGSLLSFGRHERQWAETVVLSVLLGMYSETLLIGTLMFLGVPFVFASIATVLLMSGIILITIFSRRLRFALPVFRRPEWFEWVVLAAVTEQLLFAVWQLARMHAYFDDTLTQWSGRARSLYAGVNWSMDPASPFFLGGYIGNHAYPLQLVIWRALTAKFHRGWDDVIARADGLLFLIVVIATVWLAVSRFSNSKWLAASAAFIVATIPLHAWHAAAGYSDIAVEAFVLASVASLLRKEWFIAGVMAASAVWCKNEGLFIYFPALLAAAAAVSYAISFRWRNIMRFLLGFMTIAPWLIFNRIHHLGLTSGQGGVQWHSDAPLLLWNALVESPSSSIFWIGISACIVYTCGALIKDGTGRALLLAFAVAFGAMLFVFSSTSAYDFLANETSIHRVLMQLSGLAILLAMYGLRLKTPDPVLLSNHILKKESTHHG